MWSPVPSLKALSLAAISTHIWQCRDLSTALINISLATSPIYESDQKLPKEVLIPYYDQVRPAYDAIMALDCLSESVRVSIACAFIKLETNMLQWAKDIVKVLKSPKRKENIAYCLTKTIWRSDLTVHREKTMFTVLFDSYGRIRLSFEIGNICVLTVYNFYRFIEYGTYRKHNRLSNKIRQQLKRYKPLKYWRKNMKLICFLLKLKHSKMELLMRAVKYTKVEVLDHLLNKLSLIFPLRSKVYTQLLTHVLLSGRQTTAEHGIIIYLLDRLYIFDKKSWVQYMIHHFCDIILWIFLSTDSEYCVTYFQQAYELVSVEECAATVKRLLKEMTSFTNDYGCCRAEFLKNRAVFLEIWNRTPVKVKQVLFDYLVHEKLFVYGNTDIISLCVLLSDKAFDKDQRNTMVLANVLDMQESHREQVEEFLSHLPACCKDYVKNPTKKALKTYIAGRIGSESYANVNCVFENEETLNSFKEEILHDKEFLINTFSALGADFSETYATNFLRWLLTSEDSIKKFVKEKIVGQQWIVDIIKKYLLSDSFAVKDSCLLDFFVEDAEDRLRFKKIIRQDLPLMFNVLHQMCCNCLSEITSCLPCVFNPNETDEQHALIETYLLSKEGLQAICDFVTRDEDIKHANLYTKHKLEQNLHAMKTFKNCWVEPFNLTDVVLEILSAIKIKSESPVLFPHQTERDGEVIVSRNLRMFRLILNQNAEVKHLIFNVMVETSRGTSYDHLEDDMF